MAPTCWSWVGSAVGLRRSNASILTDEPAISSAFAALNSTRAFSMLLYTGANQLGRSDTAAGASMILMFAKELWHDGARERRIRLLRAFNVWTIHHASKPRRSTVPIRSRLGGNMHRIFMMWKASVSRTQPFSRALE